jgi:4-amino-4-deoxy-L-arabinose transferase-like glycosyltransferase
MTSISRRYWLVGLFILFLIAVYLVHSIPFTYMHPDEYLVYFFTRKDVQFTVDYLATWDTHPPLWFSFFWVWRQFVGEAEFLGRVQAVFFSLIALAVVYQIGKRWFGAPRYGLFAMAVLGVSALFCQYAVEIRPYGLVMLLASLSMYSFQRWLTSAKWRYAIFYAVIMALMLYVHYFLIMMILAQGVYFLLSRPSRRLFGQAVSVVVLAFVLWSPWFPSAMGQVGNLRKQEILGGNVRGVVGAGTTTQPTSLEAIVKLADIASNGQVALYGIVFIFGLVMLWRRQNYRLALMWAVGVPVIAFTINTVAAVYAPRYILNFIIGASLVIGAGLATLPGRWRWLALVGFTAVGLWAVPSQLPKDRIPYRDLFQNASKQAKIGDVVFFDHTDLSDNFVRWQINHYLRDDLRASRVTKLDDALKARRVWQMTAEWASPDVQANFAALAKTHSRQDGWGQCNVNWCYIVQLLEAPPWSAPQVFGKAMPFWGTDVDSISRETGIQTQLWWRADQPTSINYSIGLYLLDGSGKLLSQADGPIHHFGQQLVETSQLEPSKIYIDHRTIALPSGLAAGTYQLALAVYDPATGERLKLADGADMLLLDKIQIP